MTQHHFISLTGPITPVPPAASGHEVPDQVVTPADDRIATETALSTKEEHDEFPPSDLLRPGDIDDVTITIWDSEVAERYRDAWHDVQAHFVADPGAALGEAQDLVAEAVQALADTLTAEQVSLDPHEHDGNPDTEAMRVAMCGYRDFLERVLAL